MRTCASPDCDISLEGTHGKRKWCSETCRKQTLYSGKEHCEVCGTPLRYQGHPVRFCGEHAAEASAAASRERARPIQEQAEALWNEGATARQLCETMGLKYHQAVISTMRRRGYLLPYRRPWMIENGKRLTDVRLGR